MSDKLKNILNEIEEVAGYSSASDLVRELDSGDCRLILDYIDKLKKENKELKDENFKLDYQNTRIKGALFEFEMNYYQDNLKGSVTT